MSIWTPRILSVLRIMAALLFMEHGLMKLLHFPAAQPGVPDPLPAMLMAAAVIEVTPGTTSHAKRLSSRVITCAKEP